MPPSPVDTTRRRAGSSFHRNPFRDDAQPRTDEDKCTWFDSHHATLENEISEAIDFVVNYKVDHSAAALVGLKLLQSANIDCSTLYSQFPADDAPAPWDSFLINRVIEKDKEKKEQQDRPRAGSPAPTEESISSNSDSLTWKLPIWLESLDLLEPVRDALIAPLKEAQRHTAGATGEESLEKEFIEVLGSLDSHEGILQLLMDEQCDVLDNIAKRLYKAAKRLSGQESIADNEGIADYTPAKSKYFDDDHGEHTLEFGEISTFYEGLDGFLGPPNPNLREAMESEHCLEEDSFKVFRVPNYQTLTTSEMEYWFVTDPSPERLDKLPKSVRALGIKEWPKEQLLKQGQSAAASVVSEHEHAGHDRARRREELPLDSFEAELNEKNAALREKKMEPISVDELIGARLYTGPMYCKYNGVLRDIGHLRIRVFGNQGGYSSEELSKKLNDLQRNKEHTAREKLHPEDHVRDDVSITGVTIGNVYTTTLHVINSAVLKLGKLARVEQVYRGISRRSIPTSMRHKNAVDNTRGGIEFGFLSCSTDKIEAMSYATFDGSPNTPILLDITQGLIDRGADLSWLSQYPHEKEVLFPPLTGLELLDFHLESNLLVARVRPSVNLHSLTIERVVAKMKTSHLQLLELLTEGLRFAGVPTLALQPLMNLKVRSEGRDAIWFNSTNHYRKVTNTALDTQEEVFKSLISEGHAADMDKDKLYATAELAARVGDHQTAIALLLKRERESSTPADTPELLRRITRSLLERGCHDPWPATLVELANEKTFGDKNATLGEGDFESIVRQHLSDQRKKGCLPFSNGARVRVWARDSWLEARVRSEPLEADLGGSSSVATGGTSAPKKYSGRKYLVGGHLGGGKTVEVNEESLVAPSADGIPMVLCVAAEKGEAKLVHSLLSARANPYATDKRASTALIRICDQQFDNPPHEPAENHTTQLLDGQYECIRMLIKHTSRQFFEIRNMQRQNAFDLATHNKLAHALLVMQPDLYPCTLEGEQDGSDKDKSEFLAREEWPHDKKWDSGMSTLMLTLLHTPPTSRLERVRALLDERADVNFVSPQRGCTALHMAIVDKDQPDVVRLLIEKNAVVDQKCADGRTPLLQAAQAGHDQAAEVLIQKGADIFYRRKGKRSILCCAAQYGYTRITKKLLEAAGDSKQELLNTGKESALCFAARFGHMGICDLLLREGIEVENEVKEPFWTSFHRACANGFFETAQRLLRHDRRLLNHKNTIGVTALMAAAGSGHSPTVSMLLRNDDIDLFAENKAGQNALWLAAAHGHLDVVRVLIEKYRRLKDGKERFEAAASSLSDGPERDEDRSESKVPKTTALMAAAHYGHHEVVRTLYEACPHCVCIKDQHADALLLATMQGHLDVVRAAANWKDLGRRQVDDAQQFARESKAQAQGEDGHAEVVKQYEKILEVLKKKPNLPKRKTEGSKSSVLSRTASQTFAEQKVQTNIETHLQQLQWKSENAFDGQIVPPRPNDTELEQCETPMGRFVVDQGIVVQFGPFNSLWLRVGCVRGVKWHQLWTHLKAYITIAIEKEKLKSRPGALYVAVSVRTIQAVDFTWLAEMGFYFHHYRAPGHGITPLAEAEEVSEGGLPTAELTAELVYTCWPGDTKNMVPTYSTSIEGATGLIFSTDGSKVLLVWERGSWNTPGGAVDSGESKIDALEREVKEEVSLAIDRSWDGMRYLGGWQQQCARDNLINDNFSVFAVRTQSDDLRVDGVEIREAYWMPWRNILDEWNRMGRPATAKKLEVPNLGSVIEHNLAADRRKIALTVLQWLETFAEGRGFKIKLKSDVQGAKKVTKMTFTSN